MRAIKEHVAADGTKTYKVRYKHGTSASGKPAETSQTFRLKKDAQTFAAILDAGKVPEAHAWLDARNTGKTSTYTFAQWFAHWNEHRTGITVGTKQEDDRVRARYLSTLDDMPLNVVTKAHVKAIVNKMDAKGLAPKTIKNTIQMLSTCLAEAVEEGHLPRNPAKTGKGAGLIKLPKATSRSATSDPEDSPDEVRFLTHEEFALLLAEIPPYWQPLVVFLVGTGCRWGEATAVQGRHIGADAMTVRIVRAWKKDGGKYYIGPPKSEAGIRTVDAAPQAILAAQAASPDLPANRLVFTGKRGGRVSHSNFWNRVWRPAVVRASICTEHRLDGCKCLTTRPEKCPHHQERDEKGHQVLAAPCGCEGTLSPRPGIHDLRHTHASWLISLGCSLEQVQDQLGHESILTTRKIYGHLLPSIRKQTGVAAGRALDQVPALALGS